MEYFLLSLLGANATFLLSQKKLSSVVSSALVGIVGIGFVEALYLMHVIDWRALQTLYFGATFIGMNSNRKLNFVGITLAALVYALFYMAFEPQGWGLGGALGFSAFIAVIVSQILGKGFQREKKKNTVETR